MQRYVSIMSKRELFNCDRCGLRKQLSILGIFRLCVKENYPIAIEKTAEYFVATFTSRVRYEVPRSGRLNAETVHKMFSV